MENKKNRMCSAFVKRVVSNIGVSSNNFVIIKHYGSFSILLEDAKNAMIAYPDIYISHHQFDNNEMVETYEPFLSIIKNVYLKYYFNESIDEFLSEFNVYQLQKSFFKSYIESGSCMRTEPFILDEIEFEKEKMNESVADIIMTISKKYPMLIMINNLHMAPKSTISLLQYLSGREENKNIGIIATYNDLKNVIPCVSDLWTEYITRMNEIGCIYEGGTYQVGKNEESDAFIFESKKAFEYLIKLKAMYYALDLEQAEYYLSKIYNKLEIEKVNIEIECKMEIYKLYAMISTYLDDIPNAQLLCNNLRELINENPSLKAEYEYNYILTYTHIYSGKLEKAKKCVAKCKKIAEQLKSDIDIFKSELLEIMLEMSGWHNVYFFMQDTKVSDDFIAKIQNYGYFNHLAYVYIFSYDNGIESFKNIKHIEDLDDKLVKFSEGIDLATNFGNSFLVLKGYKKNIMLCSNYGLFHVAKYYYAKCETIIGDTDDVTLAEIRNGMGYINCTTHNFVKANKSYNQALDIYMKKDMMDAVGETLYNMSINCIVANDFTKAYSYLLLCVRIIKTLRLNDLRVCNLAKVFGLLALCSARLSLEYNCILYLDTCRRFLSSFLEDRKDEIDSIRLEKSFIGNDDELFLYFFVNGLLCRQSGKYKQALNYLLRAQQHCYISLGNQFFSLIQLKMEMALVYKKLGDVEKANTQYDEAYQFAQNKKYTKEMENILKLKNGEEQVLEEINLPLIGWTIERINEKTKNAGIHKQYIEMRENMDFISIWQNIIEISDKTKNELIETASNSLMLNFGLDQFVYIKFSNNDIKAIINSDNRRLDNNSLEYLRKYFEKNRESFVTSKMKKDYNDYNRILDIFGGSSICSMICNPYFVNDKLDSLFVSSIYMKNNWNAQNTNYLLDESDLNIFDLLLHQFLIAIDKIESIDKIRHINNKLRKSSITDYLTGLKNRDGFYEKTNRLIAAAKEQHLPLELAILYIDLDNFKYYNDTFGHDVGDLVLKEIAVILNDVAGKEGFATRYGGDEFLIALVNCNKETAVATAKMTLDAIMAKNGYVSQISSFLGKQIVIPREKSVTSSIGVAVSDCVTSEDDLSELIKHADNSLYFIKHSTKNGVKLYED